MNLDPLRVMVVDDTVTYRRILSDVIEGMGDAEVVATAPQGRLALARLEQGPVDLVLLDLEMPEMDGLETLGHIRRLYPETSVVMISGQNARAAEATIRALEQGAIDFIRKPEGNDPDASRQELKDTLKPLLRHVRMRHNLRAEPSAIPVVAPKPAAPPQPAPRIVTTHHAAPMPARFEVLGVGVSTGGPNALGDFIPALPANFPLPILLVQHMPPGFTASLAEHLAKRSALQVCEATEGETIRPGRVYIAPGGRHMVVRRRPANGPDPEALIIGLNENPPENSCRPSVDVLFRSMAAQYGGGILSVIMTGMGNDGREGVRAMKRGSCHCLSQSADSCVVYGMPLAVDEAGLSDERVPLAALAYRVNQLAARGR
ncbi:MAG: chemotaxis response regulator protein-glutamate methylesterase [Holophaga sp.]|nr:chemotaxis response regulator protein-glutamate methylesterase [Holophaga sp.]